MHGFTRPDRHRTHLHWLCQWTDAPFYRQSSLYCLRLIEIGFESGQIHSHIIHLLHPVQVLLLHNCQGQHTHSTGNCFQTVTTHSLNVSQPRSQTRGSSDLFCDVKVLHHQPLLDYTVKNLVTTKLGVLKWKIWRGLGSSVPFWLLCYQACHGMDDGLRLWCGFWSGSYCAASSPFVLFFTYTCLNCY